MFPTRGCDSGVTYSTGKVQPCRHSATDCGLGDGHGWELLCELLLLPRHRLHC